MYPEDRVLVGVMPDPNDLLIARDQHWYRIPAKHAPTGIHAEYVAFYFTRKFGPEQRWSIHYFARRTGHEMVRRVDLLPDQPDHPRAEESYFKLQLGPLRQKEPSIVSLRWRRITFIQTTWDRFVAAREINDLFVTDDQFVDRVYHALKNRGIQPERLVDIREAGTSYTVEMVIPCKRGSVLLSRDEDHPRQALTLAGNEESDLAQIEKAIQQRGGPLMLDLPI